MAGALAGFMQPPVISALQRYRPPDANGLFVHRWQHATGTLTCHLDYDPPDDGAPDETGRPTHPPCEEAMVLVAAYANGQDVEHLLADWVREEIEEEALRAWRAQREEAAA